MSHHPVTTRTVVATVQDVMPRMGLAYLVDDQGQCTWGITQTTPGAGINTLTPGLRLRVTLEQQQGFELASAYSPLD